MVVGPGRQGKLGVLAGFPEEDCLPSGRVRHIVLPVISAHVEGAVSGSRFKPLYT